MALCKKLFGVSDRKQPDPDAVQTSADILLVILSYCIRLPGLELSFNHSKM